MSSSPNLPLEVIETVIDTLARDDPDFSSLKTCSLACQCFLELCRKHIFASITIKDGKYSIQNRTALVRLLSSTPEIAYHIRELVWHTITIEDFEDPSLPGILKTITKLQSLSIGNSFRLDHPWRENCLRPALLHLLHLPTLLRLSISRIPHFDFADLISCTNLRELSIAHMEYVETEQSFPSTLSHTPIQLHCLSFCWGCSKTISVLGRPDTRPIFNLAVLASITLVLEDTKTFEASRELFQNCSQLIKVRILLVSPPLTWTGIAKMLKPSMETLTHLDIQTGLPEERNILETDDLLAGLVAELEEIRHCQNVIQKMSICVFLSRSYFKCNPRDTWRLLDRVLTESGWSKLQSVPLTVLTYNCRDPDIETLQSLPQTQFPRLSSSTSIVFQFWASDWWECPSE